MRFERLEDWLRWLESHHPTEIELGLERIRSVARRLDLLAPAARVISVAGTNGKGSCVTACAELLRAAGFSVGAYTSPHLQDYNERIVVDGSPVSDREICAAFARIDAASGDISLTYFEFGTLAALEVFRQRQVDVMVLEVGLGGRLDAVNILDADVAVVTSVDLDHQAWLGDDRDSIGREKAGIYRAQRPALCADAEPPAGLLDTAREVGARLQRFGEAFGYTVEGRQWQWWGTGPDGAGQRVELSLPALPWPSLAAALQAVAQLDLEVAPLAEKVRLAELRVAGRYQTFQWRGRHVVMDVAHNPAAARHLAGRLAHETDSARVFALVAMMMDKDRVGSLKPLADLVDAWWLVELPAVPRAASVEQLRADLAELGAKPEGDGPMVQAVEWLKTASDVGDRVVIMGSFFTVGAALSAFEAKQERLVTPPAEDQQTESFHE